MTCDDGALMDVVRCARSVEGALYEGCRRDELRTMAGEVAEADDMIDVRRSMIKELRPRPKD